jgi:hypothetical protein
LLPGKKHHWLLLLQLAVWRVHESHDQSTFVMLMCGLLLYPRDIGGHICQAWESEE